MEFTELSAEDIAALEAGTNRSGQYKQVLSDFVTAGISGADVSNAFPGTKLATASAALKRHANRDFPQVRVIHSKNGDTERLALVRNAGQ